MKEGNVRLKIMVQRLNQDPCQSKKQSHESFNGHTWSILDFLQEGKFRCGRMA